VNKQAGSYTMSVKFQKEVIRDTVVDGVTNGATKFGKKDDLVHSVGEALTGGKSNTGYLAVGSVHVTLRWASGLAADDL
jgi:hypothetical protein